MGVGGTYLRQRISKNLIPVLRRNRIVGFIQHFKKQIIRVIFKKLSYLSPLRQKTLSLPVGISKKLIVVMHIDNDLQVLLQRFIYHLLYALQKYI